MRSAHRIQQSLFTKTLSSADTALTDQPNAFATVIGFIAILFWAPSGLIMSYLTHLPPLLVITCSLSVWAILIMIKLTWSQQWSIVSETPWPCWVAGIIGIFGNNLCFILAMQYAPAAHVVLIGYIWPILILFLRVLFLHEPWQYSRLLATAIAFVGITGLVLKGTILLSTYPHAYFGYLMAFLSSLFWAIYCVVSQVYQQTRSDAIGLYCGIGALLAGLSFIVLPHQPFTLYIQDVLLMIFYGATALGAAFLFWDYGIKWGNHRLLCVAAFYIPVLATLLLLVFGQADLTPMLMISLACVTVGAYLARK